MVTIVRHPFPCVDVSGLAILLTVVAWQSESELHNTDTITTITKCPHIRSIAGT